MTYQPDIMMHLPGQWAGLHCTRCQSMCSEATPCVCCQAGVSHQSATLATGGVEEVLADELVDLGLREPEVEASAEPQAEVRFVTDDDAGVAGESSGG